MAINEDMMLKAGQSSGDKSAGLQHVERYRTILENIQDGYYEVDLAGNHTFFNDALCHILRFSRKELQGKNYRSYMDDETSLGVYNAFNKVYRTGKPLSSFEYNIIRGDGEPASVELSVALMYNDQGEPCGFQGIIRDNTERKLAEEQLKQVHNELEQRVAERTAELAATNDSLQSHIAERQKVEQRLDKRRHFLEALTTLSKETSGESKFDTILKTSIRIAGEALGATSAYISTWDRECGTTSVIAEFISPLASEAEKVSDLGVVKALCSESAMKTARALP
jgi:PAS domain S-box-containing protein